MCLKMHCKYSNVLSPVMVNLNREVDFLTSAVTDKGYRFFVQSARL